MNIKNRRLSRKQKATGFSYVQHIDDGEILSQQYASRETYVVQNSITDIPFEEYVVSEQQSYVQSYDAISNSFGVHTQMTNTTGEGLEVSANDSAKLDILDNIFEPTNESAIVNNPTNPVNNTISPSIGSPLPNKQPMGNQTAPHNPAVAPASVEDFETSLGVAQSKIKDEADDSFINDMKAILNGEKVFNSSTKSMQTKNEQQQSQQQELHGLGNPQKFENKHAIFDQIAQSMEYAKAYDLGSVDLDRRFSDFDKINEVQKAASSTSTPTISNTQSKATTVEPSTSVTSEDFLRDLNSITQSTNATATNSQESAVALSTTPDHPSMSHPQFLVAGIAVADAIQIGLGAAAVVQAQVSASQGTFSLNYDKAQRLLTNEARQQMPGAQTATSRYSKRLLLISSPNDMAPLASANVIIEWDGNAFGEISTAVIRRDLLTSTEWSHSSAILTISNISRIPNTGTDPRTWPLVFNYEGTYDPAGNGYYEYSGEFEINAFGGLKFNSHEVVPRNLLGSAGDPYSFIAKGQNHLPPVPPIPAEQVNYVRSRLP